MHKFFGVPIPDVPDRSLPPSEVTWENMEAVMEMATSPFQSIRAEVAVALHELSVDHGRMLGRAEVFSVIADFIEEDAVDVAFHAAQTLRNISLTAAVPDEMKQMHHSAVIVDRILANIV